MSDQAKVAVDGTVSESHSDKAAQAKEDFKLGIKPLDAAVHQIDTSTRDISAAIHEVRSVKDVAHLIDTGVRKISKTAHKAVDSVTKR